MAEESTVNIVTDVEHILDNNPDAAGTHGALLYLAAAAERLVKDLGDMQMRLSQLEARAETRQASGHNPQSGNDAEKLDLDQLQQDAEVLQNDLSIYGFTGANYPAVKRLIKAAPGLIAMARRSKDANESCRSPVFAFDDRSMESVENLQARGIRMDQVRLAEKTLHIPKTGKDRA